MAKNKSGKTSGINSAFNNFTDKIMDMFNEVNEIDQVDKTIEITAKQKGIPATTEALKKLNKEISSVKKTLKDSDITADMYSNSSKLNDSVNNNIKTLEELYKKADKKFSEGGEFGINDTKSFYETYYVLEEQLSKMGKEMPKKFKKAFDSIQEMSKAIFKGSAQQIDDFYDISLSEIKDKALKRANRGMADVVSEIKAQYKANAETRLAELTKKKESLNSTARSSSSIDNLKQLNKLGFTDDGEIDRSKIIFKNYEQCEKVISSIRDNLSHISSEDSEKNIEVIESANELLSELESRLIIIGENKSFDKMTQKMKSNIDEAWNVGDINDDALDRATTELENLRNAVDAGEISAEEATDMYGAYSDSLIQTGKTANKTASAIKKINAFIRKGIDSDGNYKTFKDMFQQGDTNDRSIAQLDEAISFLTEHTDLLDWDQVDQVEKAQNLLYELQEVQRGYRDYSAEREAWLQKQKNYDEIDIYAGEENSSSSGQEEAEAFDKIEDSAEDAAEAKRKFVEANKEVFDSIISTLRWLGDEDEGFRKLADNLGTTLSQFGDFSSSSNFSNFIEALDKIIEKIEEVATKTGKIGLNLNFKEDSSMDVQQASKATDAYYAKILSNMRTKAKKIQSSGVDIIPLLFESPRVSDISKRYNDELSAAQEALSLGNIDQPNRTNEENAKAYLQYFEILRTARDNVKNIISEYEKMLKTGKDAQGRELKDADYANITQLIEEYKEQWAFLLSPRALPAYTITEVSQQVNKINGVTSMGKQSAADKRKKAGTKIAEMLGIDQQDTEATNIALQSIVKTLEEIKGLLSSMAQRDIFGELFGDEDGKLDSVADKVANIIQKVKELNEISTNESDNQNNLSSEAEEAERYEQVSKNTVNILSDIGKSEDDIIAKLEQERQLAEANNEVWKERLVLLNSAGEVVASHRGNESAVTGFTKEQLEQAQGGKIIHTHPGNASFFGKSDLTHMLEESLYSKVNEIQLRFSDSILSIDTSTLTKESSSVVLEIMRNLRTKLTEMYGDNPGGVPSTEAREHINAIEKEIFKSIADKLGVVVKDEGRTSQDVTTALSDADKQIIQHFKDLVPTALKSLNYDELLSNKTPDLSEEGKKSMGSYAEGVEEGESAVKESVTSVMEAGEAAGMEALDEHSPSVVYRIMGQNSMEGYILGVKDKQFELIDAVGNVLKSGFLNNGKDVKWLDDFWKDLVSKDTFSIEQLNLLPDNQDYYKTAFSTDIKGNIIQENNLTDALKSTALAVRDVTKANEERIRTEKELSTEVEKIYDGEYIEEGQRSSRNMKRTKVADGLYEYEEEISPGRRRRYQERFNDKTQEWEVDEIISTDYDKLVSEAVDATVKLAKAQHNLNLEQKKQRPNIDLIMEYNAQIREAQERLDRATLSAHDFAYETVHAVNDPAYDTKYVMGMFNDAVNEQSFFKLSDENVRFYSKLRSENESTRKSIDATTKALAGLEAQVRTTEYSYDQNLAPGLTKPVTKQSDLDELRTKRDEILNRINSLRGHSATVDDIVEIRKLISEYQLLAKAKRDANNVVDKNLGGDTLEVKVSKQIAQIDKLISKSEQYGDETQDITNKLKEQKKALEDTVNVNPADGKMATSIEAKDFYEVQSNVKILGSQLDSNIIKIKEQKKLINEYLKAYADQQKSFYKIELLKEKGESENKNAIVAETQKMEKAAKALEKVEKSLQSQGFDFSSIQNDKDSIDTEKGNVIGKYYDQVNVQTNKGLNVDLTSLDKIWQESTKYTDSFRAKVKALEDELKSFMKQGLDFNDEDAKKQLEEIKAKVTEIKTEAKSDDVQLALENTIEKTKYKIAKFIQENSAMTDEYRSKLRNLEVRLEGTDLTKAEVNDIVNSFIKLETEITKAGQTGKSFFSTIKDRLTGLNAQLIAQYLSFQDIIRYARQAATNVIQLNDAFIELSKVSNTSLENLESDFQSYANIAKDIGGTITDTINATADWARLGYNVPDSKQLAEVAMLYKNVGDGIDIDTANESLISTLRGFKLEADDALSVIDKFNEVSNNFAISSGGIGESLQRSAAAFSAANTDLSQSIALVTATNEIVQDPDTVGNMWTTVSARIRGAKTELEDMGEDTEGMVESTSKLRDLVKGITGVDIMLDENTFKDIYTIITQIGEKWDDINDIDQAALLEALAGKRQANKLSAVLGNLDHLKDAYQTAEESAGSALREQENYEKGITYSINQAKAELEEISYDLINSDFLKGLVDTGVNALEIIDKLIDKFGTLQSILLTVGTVWGSQKLGYCN